jgi:hypothetical protein
VRWIMAGLYSELFSVASGAFTFSVADCLTIIGWPS